MHLHLYLHLFVLFPTFIRYYRHLLMFNSIEFLLLLYVVDYEQRTTNDYFWPLEARDVQTDEHCICTQTDEGFTPIFCRLFQPESMISFIINVDIEIFQMSLDVHSERIGSNGWQSQMMSV